MMETSADSTNPSLADDASDDDIPLCNFLDQRERCGTQTSENTLCLKIDSDTSEKYKSELDDSSDDMVMIPVIKTPPAKKLESKKAKAGRISGTDKKSGFSGQKGCGADNKIPSVERLKKSQGDEQQSQKTESSGLTSLAKDNDDDEDSLDDKPLCDFLNKPKTQPKMGVPLMLSKSRTRRSKNSTQEKLESPSYSSNNEPLIKMKTKSLSDKKVSSNGRNTKEKDTSSDDDVPLVELIDKHHESVKKTAVPAKKTLVSRSSTTIRKSQDQQDGSSNDSSEDDVPLAKFCAKQDKPAEKTLPSRSTLARSKKNEVTKDKSSDDEPLINRVKTRLQRGARSATTPKRKRAPARDSAKKQPRKQTALDHNMEESSNDISDAEPVSVMLKHPKVTKVLRVVLERCDVEKIRRERTYLSKKATAEIPIIDDLDKSGSNLPETLPEDLTTEKK